MATLQYRIRRLDDRSLFGLLMRGKDAAQSAAGTGDPKTQDVSAEVNFKGDSVLGDMNFDEGTPSSGKYTIMRAILTLKAGASNNQESTKNFIVRRGQDGELDTIDFPQQGSGPGEEVWKVGRAREALLAAHNILTDAFAPAVNDPGTEVGQLANFAANIDTSFRGFTQGLETALQTLADQRAAEQAHNEAERERRRKENEEERDRFLQAAQEQISEKTAVLDEREKELGSVDVHLMRMRAAARAMNAVKL